MTHDALVAGLASTTCFSTFGKTSSGRTGVTATRSSSLSPSHGVGDRVLGGTPNLGTTAKPTLAARLSQFDQAVIFVSNCSDRRAAL